MAKFGQMYLNEGIHNGKQILSKSWIKESTTMNQNQYGYLWWLREEDGIFSYCAMGDGGNMICCIPEKELVVVIASEAMPNARDRWELIVKYILPCIRLNKYFSKRWCELSFIPSFCFMTESSGNVRIALINVNIILYRYMVIFMYNEDKA